MAFDVRIIKIRTTTAGRVPVLAEVIGNWAAHPSYLGGKGSEARFDRGWWTVTHVPSGYCAAQGIDDEARLIVEYLDAGDADPMTVDDGSPEFYERSGYASGLVLCAREHLFEDRQSREVSP